MQPVHGAALLPAWRGEWSAWRQRHHTAAVAVFVQAWLLWHWNLVDWKL